MKKIISILAVAALMSFSVFAQPAEKENRGDKREKMRAEQVAFITAELDLNEADAQKFWPVYNEVEGRRREAFAASHQAMKALRKAIKEGSADVEKLLDEYLDAKSKAQSLDKEAVKSYKKVLEPAKVAKLILAQEKFRRNQIGNKGGHKGGNDRGPKRGRPEGRDRQ